MTLNHADYIITQVLNKSGYNIERRHSTSTSSIYYKIFSSAGYDLLFRVADHATKKDVITLRMDRKQTDDSVRNFVRNRIADLNKRSVKHLLGL